MASLVLDPHDQELVQNPYPVLARLQQQGPVVQVGPDLWAVTRHADAVDVLSRPVDFSSALANASPSEPDPTAEAIRQQGWPHVPALLTADPPAHGRHRRLVQQAFGGRRVRQLTGVVEQIIDQLVDAFTDRGHVEVRSELAEPLPLAMITSALGLAPEDVPRVHRWSEAVVARIGRALAPSEQRQVAKVNLELQRHLADAVEQRRRKHTDDLLSDLAAASTVADDPITMAELLTILEQVMVAGNETTTRLIVFTAHRLATEPRLQEQVRQDLDLVVPLLEETLRLESPVQSKIRVAAVDTTVGGAAVPAGTRLLVHLGAANRDPEVFPDPDTLDLHRGNGRDHLAFGYGRHFCVGATLARTEARLAITALLQRFDVFEMDARRPAPRLEASLVHRGLDQLHLTLG